MRCVFLDLEWLHEEFYAACYPSLSMSRLAFAHFWRARGLGRCDSDLAPDDLYRYFLCAQRAAFELLSSIYFSPPKR